MADTSKASKLSRRDRAYFRRRQQNRVFDELVSLFAASAKNRGLTKKDLADKLEKDPAQITRWLSIPCNMELDTLSDMLLAMDAEMDHRAVLFADRDKPNYVHPMIAACLTGTTRFDTAMGSISAARPSETRSSSSMRFQLKTKPEA